MQPLISVVIVNWNGSFFIQKCIQSVIDQNRQDIEIIIVDNASTDNSIQIISAEFPTVHIIRNTINTGFAHGCNQGLASAQGCYILFLNTDAWLDQNFFQPLIEKFEQSPNIAAITPRVLRADNPELLDSCGSFWSMTTWLYHIGYSKPAKYSKYNKAKYFFALKGAVFMVKRESIRKVGAFDNSFWCYYEETDLCHRFWIAGFSCLYYPGSQAYHIGGASAAQAPNALFHFHNFKNQLQSFVKNFSLRTLLYVLPTHIILMIGISIIWTLQGKLRHAASIYQAIGWTLYHLPEIVQKRRATQILRIVSDSVYLPRLTKNPSLKYIAHAFFPNITYAEE